MRANSSSSASRRVSVIASAYSSATFSASVKSGLFGVVGQGLQLLRRDTESAAHGSMNVLSELAAVPGGDATVDQRPQRPRHALSLFSEDGKHRLRRAEVCRVARVEEV